MTTRRSPRRLLLLVLVGRFLLGPPVGLLLGPRRAQALPTYDGRRRIRGWASAALAVATLALVAWTT